MVGARSNAALHPARSASTPNPIPRIHPSSHGMVRIVNHEDLKFALVAFSAIFFVIDPLANVPVFLTITATDTPDQRRRTAARGALAAWVTLSIFAVAGGLIFKA